MEKSSVPRISSFQTGRKKKNQTDGQLLTYINYRHSATLNLPMYLYNTWQENCYPCCAVKGWKKEWHQNLVGHGNSARRHAGVNSGPITAHSPSCFIPDLYLNSYTAALDHYAVFNSLSPALSASTLWKYEILAWAYSLNVNAYISEGLAPHRHYLKKKINKLNPIYPESTQTCSEEEAEAEDVQSLPP